MRDRTRDPCVRAGHRASQDALRQVNLMVDQKRIEQFEKMAHDDPDNELGHLSLGKAYLEAGRFDDAARSLKRALQINPTNSRVYVLLATAELKANRKESALAVLRDGYRLARQRGDMMPAQEMAAMLAEPGEPPPDAPGPG